MMATGFQIQGVKELGTVYTIPARRGKAARLNKGQAIKIMNPHGKQIVDTWAFVAGSTLEYMGMEQCRAFWQRLYPIVGDKMITNRRRPILTLEADTSPGRHDTLIAPCDNERYGISSAAPATTTTAKTTCTPGWPNRVFTCPTRQRHSTPS